MSYKMKNLLSEIFSFFTHGFFDRTVKLEFERALSIYLLFLLLHVYKIPLASGESDNKAGILTR